MTASKFQRVAEIHIVLLTLKRALLSVTHDYFKLHIHKIPTNVLCSLKEKVVYNKNA